MVNGLDDITKEAIELIQLYAEILEIPIDIALKIIMKNKSAVSFLHGKSGLLLFDKKQNLGILIRITIFRIDLDDFSSIKPEEIKKVKKYYNIDIPIRATKRDCSEDEGSECYY